jgi:predicted RNA-binding Zn ribbon-like protein
MTGSIADTTTRRQPAPGGLELVRSFLNSVDIEAGADSFGTAADVEAWLAARDLPIGDTPVTDADRSRLVAVREAIRDLITCREGGGDIGSGHDVLDHAALASPLVATFDADGTPALRVDATGVTGLIGRVLAEVTIASATGAWSRLKVCRNDACRWAYYDASRNRSGVWCTMAICGNRAKGRALRDRRRRDPGP